MRSFTKDCTAVLRALDTSYRDFEGEYCYFGFKGLVSLTKMPRARVRVICRALKRKGLTEYMKGLSDGDGQFSGSGYAITDAGHERLAALRGTVR